MMKRFNVALIKCGSKHFLSVFVPPWPRELPWKEDVWIFLPNGISHICQWGFSHASHPAKSMELLPVQSLQLSVFGLEVEMASR